MKADDRTANTFTFEGTESTISYAPGDLVGKNYELISVLAKGGMGVLFKARHLELNRVFALKLLAPAQLTEINWKRFELEGRTLAKLDHPNVVQIFNMGVDDRGCPFYVMDLLDGQALSDYLSEHGPLSIPQFLQSFIEVCSALQLAYGKGIIHRDIKPANLILVGVPDSLAQIKVVDFGIARLTGDQQQALTRPGEIFGSPAYMSPEQTEGKAVSYLSDIYSLGCTMYAALSGDAPFRGDSALETMVMHQTKSAPFVQRDDCSTEQLGRLNKLISSCMAKKLEERPQSAEEIAQLLSASPVPKKKTKLALPFAGAALLLVSIAISAIVLCLNSHEKSGGVGLSGLSQAKKQELPLREKF